MNASALPLTEVRKRSKVFYGWWIILTAAIGLGLGYAPIVVYSFGVFLKPLQHEFHTGRGSISLAFTLANLAQAFGAPLFGRWTDRFGAKSVILSATVAFASVLILFFFLPASLSVVYLSFVMLGFAGIGAAPVPYGGVVAKWFDKRRGFALGLMMLGLGLGAIIIPTLAHRLITAWGWRTGYAVFGLSVLAIAVPFITVFLRESPEKMGLCPDGDVARTGVAGTCEEGLSWSEARRGRAFWLMVGAFFLVGASVHGCNLHLPAMLSDRGVPAERAALASSLVGAALMLGRVGSGYALDHFFAPRVALVFFGGAAVGMGLLWTGVGGATALLAAALVGLGLGAEVDIIAYMTSRYFGLRAYGEIYGYAFGSFALAGALGPAVMGLGFDRTGSYKAVLLGFLLATAAAALMIQKLGPYRFRPR